MARRDQPYFPLYVQDFMTDEKLANCTAESTGVYIRLLCIMHKSEDYGKILLRQKFRQSEQQIQNFAGMLARQMPYDKEVIARSLDELLDEKVIYIDGDTLCQKRMIKDGNTSEKRSISGRKGAEATNQRKNKSPKFAEQFAAAKSAANSENENEDEIEIEIVNKSEGDNPFSGELREAFDDWIAYKKEKRQSYKQRGMQSLITQIQRYADQFGESATANAIRNSMASNYQGIVFDQISKNGSAMQKTEPKKKKTFLDMYLEDES